MIKKILSLLFIIILIGIVSANVSNEIILKGTENCEYTNNNEFFDSSILIGKWHIPDNLSCDSINDLKLFFRVEKVQDLNLITGIRTYVLTFLALILLIIFYLKTNIKLNKLIGRKLSKHA